MSILPLHTQLLLSNGHIGTIAGYLEAWNTYFVVPSIGSMVYMTPEEVESSLLDLQGLDDRYAAHCDREAVTDYPF